MPISTQTWADFVHEYLAGNIDKEMFNSLHTLHKHQVYHSPDNIVIMENPCVEVEEDTRELI